MPATEFGGDPNKLTGVQPPPHVPTPAERLMLLHRTGDESGNTPPSEDIWLGLRSEETQRALREAEGVMAKGQEWERILQEGQAAAAELPKLEGQ